MRFDPAKWLYLTIFLSFGWAILYPVLPPSPFRVSPWKAAHARDCVALLKPGMTDTEVWQTLGLSEYHFASHSSGSGSPQAWPIYYRLWPGHVLFLRWNRTTTPPTLVQAAFYNE